MEFLADVFDCIDCRLVLATAAIFFLGRCFDFRCSAFIAMDLTLSGDEALSNPHHDFDAAYP
jgi:hypothetical protein